MFHDIPSSISHQAAASSGNCHHQHLQGTSHHQLSGCSISRKLSSSTSLGNITSSTVRLQHLQGTSHHQLSGCSISRKLSSPTSPGNITSSTVRLQYLQGISHHQLSGCSISRKLSSPTSPGNITSSTVRLQHLQEIVITNISREYHIINCQAAAYPQRRHYCWGQRAGSVRQCNIPLSFASPLGPCLEVWARKWNYKTLRAAC